MLRRMVVLFTMLGCFLATNGLASEPPDQWLKLVIGWHRDGKCCTTEPITKNPLKLPTVNDFIGSRRIQHGNVAVRISGRSSFEVAAGSEVHVFSVEQGRTGPVAVLSQYRRKGKSICFDVEDCSVAEAISVVKEAVNHARTVKVDQGWSDTVSQRWLTYVMAYSKGKDLTSEPYGPQKFPTIKDYIDYQKNAKYRFKFKDEESILKIRMRPTFSAENPQELHLRHVKIPNGPDLAIAVRNIIPGSSMDDRSGKRANSYWRSATTIVSQFLAEKNKPKPIMVLPADWENLKISTPRRNTDETAAWLFAQKIKSFGAVHFFVPGQNELTAQCYYAYPRMNNKVDLSRSWTFYFTRRGDRAYLRRMDSAEAKLPDVDRAYNDVLNAIKKQSR